MTEVYLGVIIKKVLINQEKYNLTINEIINLLETHKNEITFTQSEYLLRIFSKNALYEISLPLNNKYFHTCYFRIADESTQINKDFHQFVIIGWDCLTIFKENFPSQVDLFQKNLQACMEFQSDHFEYELLRRQINSIQSKMNSNEILQKDEAEDTINILEKCLAQNYFRGLKLCLNILNSQLAPACVLQQLELINFEKIETIYQELQQLSGQVKDIVLEQEIKECQYISTELCSKLIGIKQTRWVKEKKDEKINSFINIPNKEGVINSEKIVPVEKFYVEPKSLETVVFQLRETENIERVSFLLNTLLTNYSNHLSSLNKCQVPQLLQTITSRYCSGVYGIDNSPVAKYCKFHNSLIACYFMLNKNSQIIISEEMLEIIEEGVVNIVQNLIEGDRTEIEQGEMFLKLASRAIEIATGESFKESVKNIKLNIEKQFGVGQEVGASILTQFNLELASLYNCCLIKLADRN